MENNIDTHRISESHNPTLDGLRGLAILFVATGHLFYKFYIFNFGWTGLNLFFILSGYLISNRLFVHSLFKPVVYFRNFYVRRVLRIFPLYYGCLIFFFLILPLSYMKYPEYFGSLYNIQIWYWLYISNWRIIFFGLPANTLFFHFWSLAIEEQFYLIWPVIFFLVTSFKQRLFVISIFIFISVMIRFLTYGTQVSYYNTLTTAEPLFLGGLVSICEKKGNLSKLIKYFRALAILSFASLFLIIFVNPDPLITNHSMLLIGYSNVDIIWTYLILSLLIGSSLSTLYKGIFASKWLIWLGKYAYGIYVFHWIVLQLFINKYELLFSRIGYADFISYWLVRIAGIIGILLLSFLSFHVYEKKFLSLKKYFS